MRHSNTEELKIKAKLLVKQKRAEGENISLKQALDLIASKRGHANWRALKETIRNDLYNPPFSSARMNTWFSTYEEATEVLAKQPENYLLPFRNQYFICLPDYIEALGVSLEDPDLVLVGHDWVNPENPEAMERVNTKIRDSWKKNGWDV